MITSAEALAKCLALGTSRPICDQVIASQMVGGVYCDGTIVITADGHRCVPREVVERVKAARDASPLPVAPPSVSEPASSPWLVGGLVVAAVATVVWMTR